MQCGYFAGMKGSWLCFHCYFKPEAYAWQILSEAHQWQQDKIVVMSSCLVLAPSCLAG